MTARRQWEAWLDQPVRGKDDQLDEEATEVRRRYYSLYLDLLHQLEEQQAEQGGSDKHLWRKAAYAIWLSQPRPWRQPRFAKDLAHMLGLVDDDVFRKWRQQNPKFFDRAEESCRQIVRDWLPDVVMASVSVALQGGAKGFQDRKMLAEMGNIYKPTVSVTNDAAGVQVYLPDNGRD